MGAQVLILPWFEFCRYINRPLTPLSPNKSWEGFILGGCCTIVIGWIMTWMFKVLLYVILIISDGSFGNTYL